MRTDHFVGVGSGWKVTVFVEASMALKAASIFALLATPSLTTGEPFEKSRVLPSWMGTASAGSR